MKRVCLGLLGLCLVGFVGCGEVDMSSDSDSVVAAGEEFRVWPIGRVVREGERTLIVIDEKYAAGLLGLEKHSYVNVFWWFDKNDTPQGRAVLQVNPRADKNNPRTGVFATHSPFRPNLIALTKCDIVSVKDNVIEVKEIDAFDGTPVLDLKGDFFRFYRPGDTTSE